MIKKIYLVRHCKAEGQEPDATLSPIGFEQSKKLGGFFSNIEVDQLISSPFLRAVQSAEYISKNKQLHIKIDQRLSERMLSTASLPDWLDKLRLTYDDLDLVYEGGESSREATNRILQVVEEVIQSGNRNTILVAHGGILSLLLKHYDGNFGFEPWKKMTNPDVYQITYNNESVTIERIWEK